MNKLGSKIDYYNNVMQYKHRKEKQQPNTYANNNKKHYSILRIKKSSIGKFNKRNANTDNSNNNNHLHNHHINTLNQNSRFNLAQHNQDIEYLDGYSRNFESENSRYNRQRPSKIYNNQRISSANNLNSNAEYIQFKLSDLINPNRNRTFIENLYAQFVPNSNKINLLYLTSMERNLPENTMLLNAELLVKNVNNSGLNRNTSFEYTNKLLNEFYLTAIKINGTTDENESMLPRLLPSEIFLIILVISLWLASIFICLRRYSLFLCFHKRDVPYYNKQLLSEPNKMSESSSTRPLSPNHSLTTQTNHNNCTCNSLNENNNNTVLFPTSEPHDNCATSSQTFTSNLANINEKNSSFANNINNSNNINLSNNHYESSSSQLDKHHHSNNTHCYQCKRKKYIRQSTYAGTHRDTYKSISSNNFSYGKLSDLNNVNNLNKPMQTSKSCSNSKPKCWYGAGSGNKINFYENTINSNNNNGVIYYPTSSFYASSLLNKTYAQNSNNKNNLITKLNNTNSKKQLQLQQPTAISPLVTNSTNNFSNSNLDEDDDYYTDLTLVNKRSLIRNKHFNLMSLDETALNMYRKDASQQASNLKVLSELEAADVAPIRGKKLKETRQTLATPHPNFISLRSGSDSVTNSWVKPGFSYDGEHSSSNEIFSCASLNKSQSLLRPSLVNLAQQQINRSVSPINNTPEPSTTTTTTIQPDIAKSKNVILPTSQRPINPISSLRRHMFVNSRHNAQTAVDHSKFLEDSINFEQSYDYYNSMSQTSSNQLSSLANNQTHPASESLLQTQMLAPLERPEVSIAVNQPTIEEAPDEVDDPNLLNPAWIPGIVKRTLLEMHQRAVISKSDSNIKAKYRSSNHLLHSPTTSKQSQSKSGHKPTTTRKKKPLSLQNSQDKTVFSSVSANLLNKNSQNNNSSNYSANMSNANGSSYLNSFYEELRAKFFFIQANNNNNNNNNPSNKPVSTNLSCTVNPAYLLNTHEQIVETEIVVDEVVVVGKEPVGSTKSGRNSPNNTTSTLTTTISNDTVIENHNCSNFSSDVNLINESNYSIDSKNA